MFNQKILQQLQSGFRKGKLKGLSGIDPQRLSLLFTPPVNNHGVKLRTARIKLDQRVICSFGFEKVPHHTYYVMFTIVPNPQGYELSTINQRVKALKVQASLPAGRLLLLTRLKDHREFFHCINQLLKATRAIAK